MLRSHIMKSGSLKVGRLHAIQRYFINTISFCEDSTVMLERIILIYEQKYIINSILTFRASTSDRSSSYKLMQQISIGICTEKKKNNTI